MRAILVNKCQDNCPLRATNGRQTFCMYFNEGHDKWKAIPKHEIPLDFPSFCPLMPLQENSDKTENTALKSALEKAESGLKAIRVKSSIAGEAIAHSMAKEILSEIQKLKKEGE